MAARIACRVAVGVARRSPRASSYASVMPQGSVGMPQYRPKPATPGPRESAGRARDGYCFETFSPYWASSCLARIFRTSSWKDEVWMIVLNWVR